MNDAERIKMEQEARTATPATLRAQSQDARHEHAAIAQRELTRREKEMRDRNSLTGVVEPL